MPKLLAIIILISLLSFNSFAQPVFSDDGHPEHIISGAIIGGTISYLVFKKTDNKFKAWLIGFGSAALIGYLKELVDPKWFNGVKSDKDFGYSVLGGAIGASIVIPLKKKKPKSRPNIAASFN